MDTIILAVVAIAGIIALALLFINERKKTARLEAKAEELQRKHSNPVRPQENHEFKLEWFDELTAGIRISTPEENHAVAWRFTDPETASPMLRNDFSVHVCAADTQMSMRTRIAESHAGSNSRPPAHLQKVLRNLRTGSVTYSPGGSTVTNDPEHEAGAQLFAIEFLGHLAFQMAQSHHTATAGQAEIPFSEVRQRLMQRARKVAGERELSSRVRLKRVEHVRELDGRERQMWMRWLGYREAQTMANALLKDPNAYGDLGRLIEWFYVEGSQIIAQRSELMTQDGQGRVHTMMQLEALEGL